MPRHFPNHKGTCQRRYSVYQIDFLGALLLIAAMTMHLTGLEEAANLNPWKSSSVLIPLSLSGLLWISFVFSQYYVTASTRPQEPVLPWRFFQNRVAMGLIANAFLSGAISTTCLIQVPIFSQAAVGTSALGAGVHLIPYTLAMEIGAMLVAASIAKRRLPPVHLALVEAVMQLVGVVLLSVQSPNNPGYRGMYGIEAIIGLGVGAAIAVTTLMMPYATEKQDLCKRQGFAKDYSSLLTFHSCRNRFYHSISVHGRGYRTGNSDGGRKYLAPRCFVGRAKPRRNYSGV